MVNIADEYEIIKELESIANQKICDKNVNRKHHAKHILNSIKKYLKQHKNVFKS